MIRDCSSYEAGGRVWELDPTLAFVHDFLEWLPRAMEMGGDVLLFFYAESLWELCEPQAGGMRKEDFAPLICEDFIVALWRSLAGFSPQLAVMSEAFIEGIKWA